MTTFEILMHKQIQTMNLISRSLVNFKKSTSQANLTVPAVKNRISLMQAYFADVQNMDAELFHLSTAEHRSSHTYYKEDKFNACATNYEEALDSLHEMIADLEPSGRSTPQAETSNAGAGIRAVSHLPKLELPTFDGTFENWESFRDRFTSMIIDDLTLSNVERLHFLCSVLSGEANKAIGYLPITDANFSVAWDTLVSRYENKRLLIHTHLQTIFSLPQITSENSRNLKQLRDQTQSSIQALKNLGRPVGKWDDILVYLVSLRLDKASRKAWELKLSDSLEPPSYDQLDKFLESRIRALDALLPPKSNTLASPLDKAPKSKNLSVHSVTASKFVCPICKKNHLLYQCKTFLADPPIKRHEFIKSQKRCFNCLAANHLTKECKSERRCRQCSQKHHTLLHLANEAKSPSVDSSTSSETIKTDSENIEVTAHIVSKTAAPKPAVLLATARVRVYSSQNRVVSARALLDQGSAATLISERLAQLLRLSRNKQNISVTGIGELRSHARHTAYIRLSPANESEPMFPTNAIILKSLTIYTPDRMSHTNNWHHVANLNLADDDLLSADPIDIIIGADLYGAILLEGIRRGKPGEPIAQNTALGWIISGPASQPSSSTAVHTHHGAILENLDSTLRKFWEIEDLQLTISRSSEEKLCEEHFLSTHTRDPRGRYIVRLPFKPTLPEDLGESRSTALASLRRLERRLKFDPDKASAYSEFLNEYRELGHMEKITTSEHKSSPKSYYIPHHAVFRENSTTSRLRVVFNASSNTSIGKSLNDYLMAGPKLQNDLAAIILRWRQFRYVLTADIAKMYRQILIDPRDRDYQRILWKSSSSDRVEEYRLLTVTYGTTSAPFLALRVLQQLANDEGTQFPLALPALQDQIYVDDCIFGADDKILARQTRDQLIKLLEKGGFRLRKWASNCSSLLDDIDPSDHGLAFNKELHSNESLKILGISWHPERDAFCFCTSLTTAPGNTKREILSTIARLFDPLGWVTPVIIRAKILMQSLWSLKCNWDETIPQHVLEDWSNFHSRLPVLNDLALPRWTTYGMDTIHAELHGFSDASTKAYAAAVYLRVITIDSPPVVHLLVAKSKVAPIKTLSIPRLELCAALLLSRLMQFTRSTLQLPSAKSFCWTDSTIVLAWIRQPPSRWKTFVANRVAKIQEAVDAAMWSHVPTADNPTDCASRGISPDELLNHRLWWFGPEWLKFNNAFWPRLSPSLDNDIDLEERTSVSLNLTNLTIPWDLQSRFSSWFKLLRVTAFVMRFVSRLRGKRSTIIDNAILKPSSILKPDEIQKAKLFWLRTIQSDLFHRELLNLSRSIPVNKSSPLSPLSPYLDEKGLIRVRGRLDKSELSEAAKHPIILNSHPLVTTLISSIHIRYMHAGPRLTLELIRQEFWLLRARATVRSVLYRCVKCTREKAAVPEQLMGNLPKYRVTATSRAFIHTGVDYAGPISIRVTAGRGHKSHKASINVRNGDQCKLWRE